METYGDARSLAFDGGNPQALTHGFEGGVLQKVFHGRRRRAEAIFEFFAHVLFVFFGSDRRNTFVGAQSEIFAGDVVLRDSNVKAEAERGAEIGSDFFAFEFGDGPLQHLAIHIEADGFDMAVLLAAEHVASAAQFEVESGDAESGAEFAEFFHGGEAFAGDVGERGVRGNEEIRVGALSGTTDAAAELIKFSEAETVSAIDQDRVGTRNVEAVFDDGGRNENVSFIADEFQHHAFEFFLGHLAVSNNDTRFGNQLLHHDSEGIDGFDAIVNEENLAVASKLSFDGSLHQLFPKRGDDGLNGEAIAGRSFDDGHVAKTNKRHVQCARNGCGRKREGVYVFAHFFEALFVGDAEALFFVHDEKTEVGELHVFGKQAMRTDDHIDFASFQIGEDFFLFGGTAEAAEHFDARGKSGKSFLEGFKMLKREHGGGRENRDLLVVDYGLK